MFRLMHSGVQGTSALGAPCHGISKMLRTIFEESQLEKRGDSVPLDNWGAKSG